eukprot:NODE_183_length_13752_cov_1.079103.p7 type:complete len:230 gc:universal NODE_183_length_13752_cov_1.079103:9282-9971(+)
MDSSYFRFVNEQLYTRSSTNIDLTEQQMQVYHKGFNLQCKLWKTDPLFLIYKTLNQLFNKKTIKIVDVGAGDGILSRTLHHYKKLLNVKGEFINGKYFQIKPKFNADMYAYDILPINDYVEKCNATELPLDDHSCHAAVFSLSLMGTDYDLFLKEANRVIKMKGFIIIAEVQSRLVDCKSQFVKACKGLGWKKIHVREETHFCLFVFQKVDKPKLVVFPALNPCLYKKR